MLSELNQLYLQENDLSGAIPEEIESLKGLSKYEAISYLDSLMFLICLFSFTRYATHGRE